MGEECVRLRSGSKLPLRDGGKWSGLGVGGTLDSRPRLHEGRLCAGKTEGVGRFRG